MKSVEEILSAGHRLDGMGDGKCPECCVTGEPWQGLKEESTEV